MSQVEECEILEDYDNTHAQIFYSFPFKEEEEYMYQYKATIVEDSFKLDTVKSILKEMEDNDELEEYEEVPFDEENEILIENIVDLPIADAIGKMRNKIDLRIKDLQTKFTQDDKLSELYDDILEN